MGNTPLNVKLKAKEIKVIDKENCDNFNMSAEGGAYLVRKDNLVSKLTCDPRLCKSTIREDTDEILMSSYTASPPLSLTNIRTMVCLHHALSAENK